VTTKIAGRPDLDRDGATGWPRDRPPDL